ncbi:hypothetical protein FDECE_13005 [Fusarium decemcellulare]|nr:hypothetical protein FDECE_13005 [Fusarium decemcellulare]
MGLPLFIAPVESDLPPKAADKSRVTSPSRSGIRRHARPDSRERRAAMRRHVSIRDRVTNGSLRQPSTLTGREGRMAPWAAEAGFPPDVETIMGPDGLRRPRPFRDVLREMTRADDRRRDQLEEQINSLFRDSGSWQERETSSGLPDDETDLGWWAFEPRPRFARARIVEPISSRQDRDEDAIRLRTRLPPLVQQPSIPRSSSDTDGLSRRRRPELRNRGPITGLESTERRRNATLHRNRGLDGLGDRDRSLSPEVWDTLLSTLTPDPQPPSAGSSFASTVASQSAGASSNTSFTTPDPTHETTVDQACESGCDNSDTEGPDYEHPDFARIRRRREERRREEMRRVRVRVPDFNLDGPADGPASRDRDSGAVNSEGPASRRRRSPDGPLTDNAIDDPMRDTIADLDGPLPLSHLRSRHGWVGHLSIGNSDDEQGSERRRRNREGSTTSGNNLGEEDWMGMQRIVRSLARREDIPDEWWAEAGLSRTLPGDGTE